MHLTAATYTHAGYPIKTEFVHEPLKPITLYIYAVRRRAPPRRNRLGVFAFALCFIADSQPIVDLLVGQPRCYRYRAANAIPRTTPVASRSPAAIVVFKIYHGCWVFMVNYWLAILLALASSTKVS
jgi:hypothetical protein